MKIKPAPSLIPPGSIKAVAEVMTQNLDKYPSPKWPTLSIETHVDCAIRHLLAYLDGQKQDKESGLSHLAHAAARCMMAESLQKNYEKGYYSSTIKEKARKRSEIILRENKKAPLI